MQFVQIVLILVFLILNCDNTPIQKGKETARQKITFFGVVSTTQRTAVVSWGCAVPTTGYVLYGSSGTENIEPSIFPSKVHFANLYNLTPGTRVKYQAFCAGEKLVTTFTQFLDTLPPSPTLEAVMRRGIFLVGGIGNSLRAVSQIDLYDPIDGIWYAGVSSIPTPRAQAQIVSHKQKIYVIGGLNEALTTVLSTVEEYDPIAGTWRTLASMPLGLSGAMVASVGESIYLLAGSISVSLTTPPANTVYKFSPDLGSTGTWEIITSITPTLPRADMAGCSIDGLIFMSNGRNYSGVVQLSSDSYIPSSNTTTSSENAVNTARYGVASACYRPTSTDPFPSDSKAIVYAGGSTLNNINIPPNSILASSVFEIYTIGPGKTMTVATALPDTRYAASAEFSYDRRALYVFGGSKTVYVPTDSVYTYTMGSTGGSWSTLSTVMPRPRYGHKAVIINR